MLLNSNLIPKEIIKKERKNKSMFSHNSVQKN
jgi:hypothetical protein